MERLLPVLASFFSTWHPIGKFDNRLAVNADHKEVFVFRNKQLSRKHTAKWIAATNSLLA